VVGQAAALAMADCTFEWIWNNQQERGTISPEPPKPESASMLTHASLIQSLGSPSNSKTLKPQTPKPPLQCKCNNQITKKKKFRNNKLFIGSKSLTHWKVPFNYESFQKFFIFELRFDFVEELVIIILIYFVFITNCFPIHFKT